MPIYIFYKIFCKDENIKDCYVGKTKELNKRWTCHKKSCNNQNDDKYNLKLYKFIRENGNIDNWNIIEIDKGEYDDKDSSIRERYWFEELNANLNSCIPSRTRKEKCKEYREKNKEKLNEYNKSYYLNNIEKERIRHKEYREKNKDEINKKKYEKFICECGGSYIFCHKSTHFKTKKHQKYIIDEKK